MDPFQHLDDYALLGVPPDATPEEIKQAYRREIATYHPDRFRTADAATQQYARERSQRITEAYATISRNPRTRAAARAMPRTGRSRDEQLAADYDQALRALAAGNAADAVRLLRQVQKLDPFYRDVDEQLARAESLSARAGRRPPPLLWLSAGLVTLVALLGAAYAFNIVGAGQTAEAGPDVVDAVSSAALSAVPTATANAVVADLPSSDAPIGSAESDIVVAPVEPTVPASIEPTSTPAEPTSAPPTEPPAPTAEPTSAPPTPAPPTAAPPTAAPPPPSRPAVALEGGPLLASDSFGDAGSGWPVQGGGTYSIGYRDGAYAITSQAGSGAVFAYGSPLDRSEVIIGASVTPVRGVAGLIFGVDNSYRFLIAADGTYRVLQGRSVIVAPARSNAIRAGTNRLVVAAVGQRASVYANGVLLANLDLQTPLRGTTYGFVVVAGQRGGEGVFDDLTVRGLPR